MQRFLAFVPSPAGRSVAGVVALALVIGGCGGNEDCSITDSCPNQAPSVTITSPTDGAIAVVNQTVTFSGSATDPEDGPITGSSLVWISDLDGPIGTGIQFSRADLSGGFHEITLTATDSDGASVTASISLGVGGAPLVTILAPQAQSSGAPRTVIEGTSVTFSGSATDVEDGPLGGADVVWTSNVDGQIGTGTSVSTSGLTAGMHTVTLTATDSDANQAKVTVIVIVKPPVAAGYQIHIRWSEGVELSLAQRQAVDEAVTKLEQVITGDVANVPTTEFPDAGTCAGAAIPKMQESVDDVIIYLEFVPIDGPGGTVGSAGPCFVRSGTNLSLVGGMRFDTDDLETLESFGLLDDVVLHEMMHVLGFGIFWDDFLEEPSDPSNPLHDPNNTDTHFTGANAIAQFQAIGGGSYTGGAIVPVENAEDEFGEGSLDGHWRESVFDEEIMSTAANLPSNPLSVLTIGQFEDLGYTVDYGAADTYSQTFSIVLGPQTEQPAIDLSGDIWRGEMFGIDPDGTSRRIR